MTLPDNAIQPTAAAVFLPLWLDAAANLNAVEAVAAEQRDMPLVLANGVFPDAARGGVTVVVVTEFDLALARNLADDLAAAVWSRRAELAASTGAEIPGRRRPLYPFEPETVWSPVTETVV